MKKIIAIISIFIFLPAFAASNNYPENRLIGTWKLISITDENLSTGVRSDDYGPNPVGYLNYSPNGRMIVSITRNDRKKAIGKVATPGEAALLLNTLTSYAGTYIID